jgi:protein-tyrosine kinase
LRASPSRPPLALDVLERAGLMVARNKRTRTAEEYRIVIGRVLRALHDEPEAEANRGQIAPNVVMVTSARPGEGKSFTALNLAGSIAQNAGESVLLVDVDPKIRPLTDLLGLSENQGFMDLIAQPELTVDEMVVQTELPNLAIVPLGSRVNRRGAAPKDDSPAAVRPIGPMIRRLSQRFPKSLILLDAPPCLSTSDPHTLAPLVGQVVMVVEAERTQRNEVEAALDLVQVCPMVTMLLNKVRMTTSHTFGAYDYFGTYT